MIAMKRGIRILVALGVVLSLLAPIVIFQAFDPWSKVCCVQQEINIKTGHSRYSLYVYFLKLFEKTQETALSRVLQGRTIERGCAEAWQTVNTFSPAAPAHSPHYRFHGALNQADLFLFIWRAHELPQREVEMIAESLLTSWQVHENDAAAGKYLLNRAGQLQGESIPRCSIQRKD